VIVVFATGLMYVAKMLKENEMKNTTATTVNAKTDIKVDDKKNTTTDKNGIKNKV